LATKFIKALALFADSPFFLQRSQIVTAEHWIEAVGGCRQMIGRQVRVAFDHH